MPVNPPKTPDLEFAFDVGHSSIGWAVLQSRLGGRPEEINLLGCGVVTFRADDCLASSRRAYRRQRRHIRATRQRIARLKALLLHLGVMTQEQLDKPGCAWPWLLAARVLKSAQSGKAQLLQWPELWDVIRWYAHNRGYDGNRNWANEVEAQRSDDEEDDTEKVENARKLMGEAGTASMAETVCAVSGLDPLGQRRSCNVAPAQRFKARNAAFPREVVEKEVRTILESHSGRLPRVDAILVRALMEDWKAISCPAIQLPKRYARGLLFGQLIPRFENRIISTCPITFSKEYEAAISGGMSERDAHDRAKKRSKVPSRNCPEFLNFRWGMQLANIRVSTSATGELRALEVHERESLDERIHKVGAFTTKELTEAVREVTGCKRDNLETMLLHPDAKEALIVDPIQKKIMSGDWGRLFPKLPEQVQKHTRIWLARGKTITLQECVQETQRMKLSTETFESELALLLSAKQSKRGKKDGAVTREGILADAIHVKKLLMRAPYSREMLAKAFKEVMNGTRHPKEEGGCLYITEEMRKAQLNRPIAEQTNNHLVRHRLLILERLLGDMVKEFAGGEKARVARVTVEVNRDLQTMSGLTAKEKEKEIQARLGNFKSVQKLLEERLSLPASDISAGLIRKARIAHDLNWTCPYTEKQFEPQDLITPNIDRDHIIPFSQRTSNSLDSLVITFKAVNEMKKKRTALQFVIDHAGQPVEGAPHLTITTPERFRKFVESLDTRGHEDDRRRKKKRKQLLLIQRFEEKEFLPGDLTKTSQLVRLAVQSAHRHFADSSNPPRVISLPGAVTGAIRKSWRVERCVTKANSAVLDEDGQIKTKTEMRDITHLHHALDACVIAFASHFVSDDGSIWRLIARMNRLSSGEQAILTGLGIFSVTSRKTVELRDLDVRLKEQITERLNEKRVVQHIPSDMSGLAVNENTAGVMRVENGRVYLRQSSRDPKTGKRLVSYTHQPTTKVFGLNPKKKTGLLKRINGIKLLTDNYGIGILHNASDVSQRYAVVQHYDVWHQIEDLKVRNAGKSPTILRIGSVVRVMKKAGRSDYSGTWTIRGAQLNQRDGVLVDICSPDVVDCRKYGKLNVRLQTLEAGGLVKLDRSLTGKGMCPTTSSASTPPSAR
jgi:hypothetical protein